MVIQFGIKVTFSDISSFYLFLKIIGDAFRTDYVCLLHAVSNTENTCAYQEVRNGCFSGILACFAFLKHPF